MSNVKSVYIHIPFCDNICSYCDFCKFLKNDEWVLLYLESLKEEISKNYKDDVIETIYVGGGTPSSLNIDQLKKLFKIISVFKFSKNLEFTFECNIENITEEKLKFLYDNGVNRLSIGVQTFNDSYLKFLNRKTTRSEIIKKISLVKKVGFDNINIDLMYGFNGQSLKELEDDIDLFLKLKINHISTYSLIIEPNTKLYIDKVKNIDEDLDYDMYKLICEKLKDNGYNHYEISNFAHDGYQSRHNLTYWNNNSYYGFGLGASGYIDNLRYTNTRSLNKYINKNYLLESHKLDQKEKLENEFILGFRKIQGINKKDFKKKYNISIENLDVVKKLLNDEKLLQNNDYVYINPKYIYISNEILINFID